MKVNGSFENSKNVTKRYSQKEIAEALNVSRATIDRVLHNRGDISEKTTKRVLDYLDKIDYRPNRVARGLSKNLRRRIHVLYHVAEDDVFRVIRSGIQAASVDIADFGFEVSVSCIDRNSDLQIEEIERRVKDGVDAFVLSPYEPERLVPIINDLSGQGIPVVTFNNDVPNSSRLCYVGTDYFKSGCLAGEVTAKSVNSGQVLFLTEGDELYWSSDLRMHGFKHFVNQVSQLTVLDYLLTGPQSTWSQQLREILHSTGPVQGVCILAQDNGILIQAVRKYCDPTVKIVAYDLTPSAAKYLSEDVNLVVIGQDPFSQGYLSTKILFNYFFLDISPQRQVYFTRLDVIYRNNIDNYDAEHRLSLWNGDGSL